MKNRWMWVAAIVAALAVWATTSFLTKTEKAEKVSTAKAESKSYWTCPMHPQIHTDKPGECPICHMKLVQVTTQKGQDLEPKGESRSEVQPTDSQLALLGVQKHTVEKMDLTVLLPISGRFLSSSSVAFQVYESDLRYVKSGLPFKGESSFYPEEEISGTITSVDSFVDPTSRTARVVGVVKKGPRGLFSETTFRGEVEINLKDRVAIPESSVLHTGSGDLVYVFSDGSRLSPRSVKLGPKTESFYEVLDGLKVGEMISSGPNFLIDSEAKIRGAAPEGKQSVPSCPEGQHWDVPMAMCMPGNGN